MRSTSSSVTKSPEDSFCAINISVKGLKIGVLYGQDRSCEEQRKRKRSSSSDITSFNGNEPVFGHYTAQDVLMVLKQLAINPFKLRKDPEVNQVLHVRKIMVAANGVVPPKKRKLQQLTKPGITDGSRMASKKNDHRNQKKIKGYNDVSSPVSCAYELEAQTAETLEDISGQKLRDRQTCYEVRHHIPKAPSLVEVSSSENIKMMWDSSIYKDPKQCHVPIGPHFQADIPEWTSCMKFDSYCSNVDNAADLRWLGTRVWPMEGKTTNRLLKDIGKGRAENCSCLSSGYIECVNQCVLEQRVKLQSELGSAFQSWRIDEMGEAITKSWTTKEHKSFNSLVKKSMSPRGVDFWQHASKCFRGKSDKELVHCFLNVYIPRRIGLQTRLSLKSTDTDDSENGENVDDSKCNAEARGLKKSRYHIDRPIQLL